MLHEPVCRSGFMIEVFGGIPVLSCIMRGEFWEITARSKVYLAHGKGNQSPLHPGIWIKCAISFCETNSGLIAIDIPVHCFKWVISLEYSGLRTRAIV